MKYIKYVQDQFIARISLNRPEVRNAFNPEMIAEITKTFQDISKNSLARVVHFSGEGKVFCAGGDLAWMKEMKSYSKEQNMKDSHLLFEMFQSVMNCPLPIVTSVHGAAFGGALGLIACSDYVLADSETQFCFSEVKLGIAPAVISGFILQKTSLGQVGPWMLSGHMFNSAQAKDMGLVHKECEEDSLNDHTLSALNWFKEVGPQAVKETKKLIHSVTALTEQQRKEKTAELIAKLRVSDEGQEGLSSFLEKRKPSWRID